MSLALKELSITSLKALARDIRAQVDSGLMNNKDAHDRINVISAVIMQKELEKIENDIQSEEFMTNEEYDEFLFREKDGISEGDELMTNGWEA